MIRIHLQKLLDKRDMSQRKLRSKTGIRPGTVSAYCGEYIKRINIADLDKICKALNCRLDELIEHIPDEENK